MELERWKEQEQLRQENRTGRVIVSMGCDGQAQRLALAREANPGEAHVESCGSDCLIDI